MLFLHLLLTFKRLPLIEFNALSPRSTIFCRWPSWSPAKENCARNVSLGLFINLTNIMPTYLSVVTTFSFLSFVTTSFKFVTTSLDKYYAYIFKFCNNLLFIMLYTICPCIENVSLWESYNDSIFVNLDKTILMLPNFMIFPKNLNTVNFFRCTWDKIPFMVK